MNPLRPIPTSRRTDPTPEPALRTRARAWRWLGNILFFVACALTGAGLAWGYKYFFWHTPLAPPVATTAEIKSGLLPIIRGIAIPDPPLLDAPGTLARWETTFDQIHALNANWVALHPAVQTMAPRFPRPLLAAAHHRGLKVALVPDIPLPKTRILSPKSYQQAWLAAAQASQEASADLLCILNDKRLALDDPGWRHFFAEMRTHFNGPLAFAAPADDYSTVTWFDAVDYLALTGPFPLSDRPQPTQTQLESGWAAHLDGLESLAAKTGKPALLLDVTFTADHPTYPDLPRMEYRATLTATKDRPHLAGLFLVDWPLAPDTTTKPAKPDSTLSDPTLRTLIKQQWTEPPTRP